MFISMKWQSLVYISNFSCRSYRLEFTPTHHFHAPCGHRDPGPELKTVQRRLIALMHLNRACSVLLVQYVMLLDLINICRN